MGKIKAGIDSNMVGKVGPHVYRMWKGRNVAAILPASVHNPNTNKQQIVRTRFKKIIELAHQMYDGIFLGMSQRAQQNRFTESNYFMRVNWSAVSASSPEDITVNYPDIKVAEGSIKNVTFGTTDWGSQEHLTIAVEFNGNIGSDADEDDDVYIMAYVPMLGEAVLSTPSSRDTEEVSVAVPAGWSGMTAHLYGFCVGQGKSTTGKVSNSAYIGHGEIA